MGFDNQYQQAGYKGLERFDITIRVIETIDLMGDLYVTLRKRGITVESNFIWEAFIGSFFKVFQITASMLKQEDIELIAAVENAFCGDIELTPETSGSFLAYFEEYLYAMKRAGIYDPTIIKHYQNPAAVWEKST